MISAAHPSIAAETTLIKAIALHNAGRDGDEQATAEAIKSLQQIIKTDATNAEALAYLGSSYAITARDSSKVVDKVRYTNRGLRFLDQAVSLAPNAFVPRLIRANVTSNLPSMFGRKEMTIEDALVLDKMFSAAQSPSMAASMVGIYEILGDLAESQGDWKAKADAARRLAN